ncbi:MAG: hypothetical protein GY953_54480 [bacterium]|nr:hypothetical protein [bacterium]
MGAISIWNRDSKYLRSGDTKARDADPNVNILIREPGHIEYASQIGLGVYDLSEIRVRKIEV